MDTFRSWPRDQGGNPEPKEKTTLGNLGRPGKKKSGPRKPKRRWIHSGPGLETREAVLSQRKKTTLGNLGSPGKKNLGFESPKRRWIHSDPGLETREAVLSQRKKQLLGILEAQEKKI